MDEFLDGTTAEHAFAEHEHRDLAPGIDQIHESPASSAASRLGISQSISLMSSTGSMRFSSRMPPGKTPGSTRRSTVERERPWATKLMTFEHQQILEVAKKLEDDRELFRREPDRDQLVELRSRLFGLEALLRAHIEREDRFLIPLLEGTADIAPADVVAAVDSVFTGAAPTKGRSL